ncbi:hypothetical protein FE810_09780 [Thalassotalea litorea]|uniref:Uncharacterized protein n=1 Tax=Thalassotalea litorea TaxID=2020715 RepID=A0A5R9IMB5_9GAMM|nr:hypothetical protein [Thalassotalea litorea]TLU65197.1 hypothetical protein FE810_09780 [Thalassotalea litorea]
MNKLKKAVLPLALSVISAIACNTVNANENEYQSLSKQIDIMEDIFTSAIKNSGDSKSIGLMGIESMYLANQGVVFTVKSQRNYKFSGFTVPMPVVPVAPLAPAGFEDSELFGEDLQDVIDEAMEEAAVAMEMAQDHMRADVERQRQLRELERELAYELRDIERENRDLAYKKRTIDKDELKEIEQETAKLEQRKKRVLEQKQDLSKRANALKAEQEKEVAKQRQQQQAYFNSLEANLSEVLCTYGGGLKSLPGDEHVSLIIKDAAVTKASRGNRDRVLVFSKSDIKKCLTESIDAKTLLETATRYQI